MTKYIDVEKLKAELRRQKHELELLIQSQGDYGQSCQIVAYENILSLLDSLQKEQLEVDLEKEIRSMWEKCNPTDEGMGVESTYMHIEAFDIIVRYFFNLGLNARKV